MQQVSISFLRDTPIDPYPNPPPQLGRRNFPKDTEAFAPASQSSRLGNVICASGRSKMVRAVPTTTPLAKTSVSIRSVIRRSIGPTRCLICDLQRRGTGAFSLSKTERSAGVPRAIMSRPPQIRIDLFMRYDDSNAPKRTQAWGTPTRRPLPSIVLLTRVGTSKIHLPVSLECEGKPATVMSRLPERTRCYNRTSLASGSRVGP